MSKVFHSPEIKALVFDVADVLIELDIEYAISNLKGVKNNNKEKIKTLGKWPIYDAFERGLLSAEEFINQLKNYLEIDLIDTELVDWWNSSIRKMVDGVEEIVRQVFDHLPVFALTNTNPIHHEYLMNRMPIFQKFEGIITSFHLGNRKPEKEIFQKASKQIGLRAENILFIDDNEINVKSAKDTGYHSERSYRSSHELYIILSKYNIL